MLADPPVLMFTAKTGNTMPRISTNINYGVVQTKSFSRPYQDVD